MPSKIVLQARTERMDAKLASLVGKNQFPAFEAVGRTIANRIRLCFRLGKDPFGVPWAPIKWRAPRRGNTGRISRAGKKQIEANAGGAAGQPLRDTGRLQRSITSRAWNDFAEIGTSLRAANGARYPAVHQFGATITPKKGSRLVFPGPTGALIFAKKVTIPARPFLPLTKAGAVNLPKDWNDDVIRVLRARLLAGKR